MGFEPTTPGLQSRCSARLSYVPVFSQLLVDASMFTTPVVLSTALEQRPAPAATLDFPAHLWV